MQVEVNHFTLLRNEVASLEAISDHPEVIGYFAQEALRFYSIAGTLIENDMLQNKSAADRQISHILGRSLLEGFFWLLYIFDDAAKRTDRFQEKKDAFKREYAKLWNDPLVPRKAEMEPAADGWAGLDRPKDMNTMLAQLRNDHGDRLNFLYSTYRISSFDTHGNSMESLFQSTFGKQCKFSVLDFVFGFDIIANQYLVILHQLRKEGEI